MGIEQDAAVKQRVTNVVQLMIRDTQDRLDERLLECIGAGERRSMGERVDVVSGRGTRAPVDGLVEPLHDGTQRPCGAIVVLRDRQAEASLQ